MTRKLCGLLACVLILLPALTACGSDGFEGVWRMDGSGLDLHVELGKDGLAFYYDALNDILLTGSWTETEEGVTVTFEGAAPLELTADGKDTLKSWVSATPFVRTKGLKVPHATLRSLCLNFWIDADTGGELEFDDDGSWEILDSEYDTLDLGGEGSVEVDGDNIILTSVSGRTLKLKLSDDGRQITGYENMTFVQTDLFADQDSDDGADEEEKTDPSDFYGVWEYENTEISIWLDIRGDGTYDWHSEGDFLTGSYTVEEDELVLDNGYRYTLDGYGGLVDDEGDSLFPSTLPENGGGGYVGCWESEDSYDWLYIYGDGTFEWYGEDGIQQSGSYWIFDGELCIDMGAEMWFYMGEDGWIHDDEGSWNMYPSELPDNLR